MTFAVALSLPSFALAKPVECTARDGARSMVLQDHSKELAYLILRYGKEEIRCPYRRAKITDTKPGNERKVTVSYKKSGKCDPKDPQGKASRSDFDFVVQVKGPQRSARLENGQRDMGTPCELRDFQFEHFGLKGR